MSAASRLDLSQPERFRWARLSQPASCPLAPTGVWSLISSLQPSSFSTITTAADVHGGQALHTITGSGRAGGTIVISGHRVAAHHSYAADKDPGGRKKQGSQTLAQPKRRARRRTIPGFAAATVLMVANHRLPPGDTRRAGCAAPWYPPWPIRRLDRADACRPQCGDWV
jgi:hypothetical protein